MKKSVLVEATAAAIFFSVTVALNPPPGLRNSRQLTVNCGRGDSGRHARENKCEYEHEKRTLSSSPSVSSVAQLLSDVIRPLHFVFWIG